MAHAPGANVGDQLVMCGSGRLLENVAWRSEAWPFSLDENIFCIIMVRVPALVVSSYRVSRIPSASRAG